MSDLRPIENNDSLYRDESTQAIINKNKDDYKKYIENRKRLNCDKERINQLENKVDSLCSDLGDIKNLLQKIVDK